MDNITLDASNFVGVIAPAAVESASPMSSALAKSVSDGNVYSFRDGAVVVRRDADRNGAMYSAAEGGTIDTDTVSLDMKVSLADMGIDASRMSPVGADDFLGFVINGYLDKIKVTKDLDVDIDKNILHPKAELKLLDLHLDGDVNFDVKFSGKGSVTYGYFSQAWNEVDSESIKTLGVKWNGLSSGEKIGKFPLAGLVFSVPCPPQKPCLVGLGKTKTPLQQAKELGVIVWVYLTLKGDYSLDGELHLARLNPADLSIGIKKTSGSDFSLTRSLTRISSSGRLLEAPAFNGTLTAQVDAGITLDVDFFSAGVRVVNAGMDLMARKTTTLTGEASYGTESLNSPWSWDGSVCRKGSIGAGAVFRGSAAFGIEVDTSWIDASAAFNYTIQTPKDEDMDIAGWHGAWYTKLNEDVCIDDIVTHRHL